MAEFDRPIEEDPEHDSDGVGGNKPRKDDEANANASVNDEPQAVKASSADGDNWMNTSDLNGFIAGARSEQASQHRDVLPDKLIEGYECVRVLGRGAQAIVFEVQKKNVRQAIKVFTAMSPVKEELYKQEVDLMSRLDHPNVVRIFDYGNCRYQGETRPYLAMEVVEGAKPLAEYLEQTAEDEQSKIKIACELVRQVCRGLHHAHVKQVIHRDLKPNNILVDSEGRAKIADFGVARDIKPVGEEEETAFHSHGFFGTLKYSSPEHLDNGSGVDVRSDVYSLGVVLYELLAGRSPYTATKSGELINAIQNVSATPLHVANKQFGNAAYRDLDAIVAKTLEWSPDLRYQSAHEFENDLNRYLDFQPVLARHSTYPEKLWKSWKRSSTTIRSLIVTIAALATCVLSAVGWHYYQIRGHKRAAEQRNYAGVIDQVQRARLRSQPRMMMELLDSVRPGQRGGYDDRGWEWDHLKRLCHSESLRLTGHEAVVHRIAYQPGGELLATASADGSVKLWSAKTGELNETLAGHHAGVGCLAFRGDGKILASGSDDATVRVWDVATAKPLHTLGGHVLPVQSVAFHPEGKWLVSGAADGALLLHDLDLGTHSILSIDDAEIRACEFSPNGSLLAVAATDQRRPMVEVWDFEQRKIRWRFDGNTSYLHFVDNGNKLLYGGVNDLRLADLASGETVLEISHKSAEQPTAVLPDTQLDLSGGGSIGQLVRPTKGFSDGCPAGDDLILTLDDGWLESWQISDGALKHQVRLQGDTFAVSQDGRNVAIACADYSVRIWPIGVNPDRLSIPGHYQRTTTLAFHPNGEQLVSGSIDHSLRSWDTTTGEKRQEYGEHKVTFISRPGMSVPVIDRIYPVRGHSSLVNDAVYSPDGSLLASVDGNKNVFVWNSETGQDLFSKELPAFAACVAWSPDGKQLAVGSWDDAIHLFEINTRNVVRVIEGHDEDVYGVAFINNGKTLISVSADKTMRLWNPVDGKLQRTIKVPTRALLTSLAVSNDERLVAIGDDQGVILLYETASWRLRDKLFGHTGRVSDLAFSPSGKRLASVSSAISRDSTLKLWDTHTHLELLSLPGAYACDFSPDGRQLAVGFRKNEIRIYQSAPIDGAAYRVAVVEPLAEPKPLLEENGPIRILGSYYTETMQGIWGAAPVIRSLDKERQLLVAVVSIPKARTVLDETAYQVKVKQELLNGKEPPGKRECTSFYQPGRFRMVDAAGTEGTAAFIGVWPPVDAAGVTPGIEMSSTRRIPLHERVALVVAFEADPKGVRWPVTMHYDELSATLDEATMTPDPRLFPDRGSRFKDILWHLERKLYERSLQLTEAFGNSDEYLMNYNAGRLFALMAGAVAKDEDLEAEEREQRVQTSTILALEALQTAVKNGLRNPEKLTKDDVFKPLSHREDFQAIVAELERLATEEGDAAPDAKDGVPRQPKQVEEENERPEKDSDISEKNDSCRRDSGVGRLART